MYEKKEIVYRKKTKEMTSFSHVHNNIWSKYIKNKQNQMIFTVYIVQTKPPALLLYHSFFFCHLVFYWKVLKTRHTKSKGHKLTSPKKTQTKETQHWSKPNPWDHKRSIDTCWKPNVERETHAETSPTVFTDWTSPPD